MNLKMLSTGGHSTLCGTSWPPKPQFQSSKDFLRSESYRSPFSADSVKSTRQKSPDLKKSLQVGVNQKGLACNTEKCYFEQKNCTLRDSDSGDNLKRAPERTKKGRVYKGKNHCVILPRK